ncbi:MAG: dihydrofolate reductase family protein [Pseudomonadota bacterium]
MSKEPPKGLSDQWQDWLAKPDSAAESYPALAIYHPLMIARQTDQPFIIGQLGQSLDGRIATETGHSHYINGPDALKHLHRLRALVDAVVVGAGTIMADDPELTVRRVPGPSPARVVIDPKARTPVDARWRHQDDQRRFLMHSTDTKPPQGHEGCDHIAITPNAQGHLPITAMIAALAQRGIKRLLIEGGSFTVSQWLVSQALNRLHFMVGTQIIGSGPTGLNLLPAIATMDQTLRPSKTRYYPQADGDLLIDCTL